MVEGIENKDRLETSQGQAEQGANEMEDLRQEVSSNPELPSSDVQTEDSVAGSEPEQEEQQIEDTSTGDAADEAEANQDDSDLAVPDLHPGDVVEGTVVQVLDDQILVDVGYKTDGTVRLQEMRLAAGQTPQDRFQSGDKITVYVLEVDQEGNLYLSERRVAEMQAWEKVEAAFESGEVLEANVTDQVKGGLVIDLGLRAFMPASHVERGYVNDLSVYVGLPIRFRVIELDRSKNRVIISQKVVLEEEHQRLKERTWNDLEENQVRRGVVKGITDFGAFIDLGGVDGLLHVSEMAWGRVNHPSEVVEVGDEIDVKILRLDREKEKISLGLKQVLPDPWDTVAERYPVNSTQDGVVMRLASFGAFVQLEPGVEGLVHISQLADHHVNETSDVVSEGQQVRVKVLRVQPEERRISLSIRDADRETPAVPREERERVRHREPRQQQRSATSGSTDAVTLGDMFGDLLRETKDQIESE